MSILQGTIPDDWEGDYCCYSVLWPNSPQWMAILRGVLVLPSRGRFWDENTGNIIAACNVIKQTYDTNLHLEECLMSCNDPGLAQIAVALTKIANSMAANGSNCCDGGGSGGAPENPPPFNPTEQLDPVDNPPPEGYDTWEQFFAQKCAIAYNIISNLQSDLGTMTAIEWGSASAEAITASLLIILVTPIPAAALIAFVFFLLTVAATVICSTALSIVNDGSGDLICELYNGTSSGSSLSMFLSKFNELTDSAVSDPVENYAIKALMSYLVTSSVTNQLYTHDNTISYPEQDCTACQSPEETMHRLNLEHGVTATLFVPADWFGMTSDFDSGYWVLNLQNTDGLVKAQFRDLVGWTSAGAESLGIGQEVEGDIYLGNDIEDFFFVCNNTFLSPPADNIIQWTITSTTAFTLDAKFTLLA